MAVGWLAMIDNTRRTFVLVFPYGGADSLRICLSHFSAEDWLTHIPSLELGLEVAQRCLTNDQASCFCSEG